MDTNVAQSTAEVDADWQARVDLAAVYRLLRAVTAGAT